MRRLLLLCIFDNIVLRNALLLQRVLIGVLAFKIDLYLHELHLFLQALYLPFLLLKFVLQRITAIVI